jgi:hypothetical protein
VLIVQHYEQKIGSGEKSARRIRGSVSGRDGQHDWPHSALPRRVRNCARHASERADVCFLQSLEVENEPAVTARDCVAGNRACSAGQ